jgi:hypothetical protein
MADMKEILKAKLRRGAGLGAGELSLVITDILTLIEDMEAQLEALNSKLDALPRGGNRGSKKTADSSKVQLDEER